MTVANPQQPPAPAPAPSPSPATPPAGDATSPWKAAFSSKSFLLAALVLGLAAVGLNAATEALQVYFKKQPVPLRARLDDPSNGVPGQLDSWVMVDEQNTLSPDVQHSLGTSEFIFRTYVDTAAVPTELAAALTASLNEKDPAQAKDKQAVVQKIQEVAPHAVLALNVTYYTGMVDTVTHIPERCMVADGFEPKNPQSVTMALGTKPDGSTRDIPVQFFTFEDQTGRGRMNRHVAYFFHCNGGYEPNPVAVRVKLQNLFERHGYYAKVEVMSDEPARRVVAADEDAKRSASARQAQDSMARLLTQALPAVEKCLPDWAAVKAGAPAAK